MEAGTEGAGAASKGRMHSQGRVMKPSAVVLSVALLAAGCGSRTAAEQAAQEAVTATGITSPAPPTASPSPIASPTPTPYAGPLFIEMAKPDDPDVRTRGGAAVAALECTGSPTSYGPGHDTKTSAAAALADFVDDEGTSLPSDGYRIEREEAGRVLYSYDVEGRTKVAIIISNSPREGFESGWHVESQAGCDPAEFPDAASDALGVGVWTDKDGVRVPTSKVQSSKGPEHCNWQSVTFLYLGRQQYLRDPNGAISHAQYKASFDPAAALPADAKDTGFRLDGKSLWLAADESAAYVGTGTTVERWPAPVDMVGCA